MGDAVVGLKLGQEVGLHAGHGNNFHPGHFAERLDVLLACPANAHNTNFEGCRHSHITHSITFS